MWYLNEDYILIHQTYRIALTWHYLMNSWKIRHVEIHSWCCTWLWKFTPTWCCRGFIHVSNVFLFVLWGTTFDSLQEEYVKMDAWIDGWGGYKPWCSCLWGSVHNLLMVCHRPRRPLVNLFFRIIYQLQQVEGSVNRWSGMPFKGLKFEMLGAGCSGIYSVICYVVLASQWLGAF